MGGLDRTVTMVRAKWGFDVVAGLGSIGSVQVDGSGFREVKVEGVSAVALSDDTLLWMTVGGEA